MTSDGESMAASAARGSRQSSPEHTAAFADVLAANHGFAATFVPSSAGGVARRGLAIVTCMDSRLDPLRIVGMQAGDAKILRNAGARVTDDVLRTLVLATHLLGVTRILVLPHTDCRMARDDESAIHAEIWQRSQVDTRSVEIRTVTDQFAALAQDVQRLRSFPLLVPGVDVLGALFDVSTGTMSVPTQ